MTEPEEVEEIEKIDDFSKYAYSCFEEAPYGRELMNILISTYLMAPTMDNFDSPNAGYYREGQNDLIRQLISGIERYKHFGGIIND